jgi:segregation and condensation protein A
MSDAMHDDEFLAQSAIQLELTGFEGPLDLLLELARRQAVDISKISAIDLVDQFLAATSDLTHAELPMVADWLVMAAWLVWLKSRLLLPKDTEEARQAVEAASVLSARLEALERIRVASEWLEHRPRLGRDFFGRGSYDAFAPIRLQTDFVDLMQAVLSVLRAGLPPDEPDRYRPRRLLLWTSHQAMARMRQLIAEAPGERDLLAFVPALSNREPDRTLRACAAVAATLLASLELVRGGEIDADQTVDFGPIAVRAACHTVEEAASGDGAETND